MGWETILELPPTCYYHLVKVFYSNSRFNEEGILNAISNVKGVEIVLNIGELGRRLGISPEGHLIFWEPRKKFDEMIDVGVTYRDIMVNYTGDIRVNLKQLKPIPHAIAYIIQHNSIPRRGHRGGLTSFEAYVTYCVHSRTPVNLSYIILRMMMYAKRAHNRALPFGRLLTRIFKSYGIDLEGEDCTSGKKINKDVKTCGSNFHCDVPHVGVQAAVDAHISRAEFLALQQQVARNRGDIRYMRRRVDQIANHLKLPGILNCSSSSSDVERPASDSE